MSAALPTAAAPAPASRHAPRVMVFSDAAPERNGVGTYYRDLEENLAGHLGAFEMVCPGSGLGKWLEIPLPGDSTQRVSVPAYRALARHVRAFAPDVVLVATPGPWGMSGRRLARKLRKPLAYGFHTDFEHLTRLYWGRLFGPITRWYLETMNRQLFRRAVRVLCHSVSMTNAARELGAERTRLVATLLPAPFLAAPPPVRDDIRRVLFVGRLAAEKRVDRLLDAAGQLDGLEFSIAGDGPQRGLVEEAARRLPNVRYLGWQERDVIPRLLAEHDLLVLPSDVEAFGTVALEAMACQRTPLVSEHCGIADWPDLAPMVYRFEPGRPLAEAIERAVARSAEERRGIAERGRQAALALNEQGVSDWLQLLDELAAEPPREP